MKQHLLIDTNIYSALMGGDINVLRALSEASTIYMSIFVLGELYAGFQGGSKEANNRSILAEFLTEPSVVVLEASHHTAEQFAHIQSQLRKQGTPIPINDVWIAAHALEHNAVLYTLDQHFQHVAGVTLLTA